MECPWRTCSLGTANESMQTWLKLWTGTLIMSDHDTALSLVSRRTSRAADSRADSSAAHLSRLLMCRLGEHMSLCLWATHHPSSPLQTCPSSWRLGLNTKMCKTKFLKSFRQIWAILYAFQVFKITLYQFMTALSTKFCKASKLSLFIQRGVEVSSRSRLSYDR